MKSAKAWRRAEWLLAEARWLHTEAIEDCIEARWWAETIRHGLNQIASLNGVRTFPWEVAPHRLRAHRPIRRADGRMGVTE